MWESYPENETKENIFLSEQMEISHYMWELGGVSPSDWRVKRQKEMLTDWIDEVLTPGYYSFFPSNDASLKITSYMSSKNTLRN